MFLLTVRKTQEGKSVVTVCEKVLVGKVFEEDELVLDLRGDFFFEKGITVETDDFEMIAREVREAFTSSIVGNEIVSKFVKEGIIKSSNVKEICGIKYAMTFRI
jgi:hypothetical protein